MNVLIVIKEAVQTAYDTLAYLWGHAFSIALVFIMSAAFQALFERKDVGEYRASSKAWKRASGALALGVFSSPQRKILSENINRLTRNGKNLGPLAAYLVGGCNLTVYYWLLLGPLLGKEFVVANLVAAALCLSVTYPMVCLIDMPGTARGGPRAGQPSETKGSLPRRFIKIVTGEVIRLGPWVLWGSFLGGLIAVWGLSSWWFDLSQIGATRGWLTQLLNALIGLGFAVATFSVPVANLFLATYLWKTGIAFSGFLAYLYGGFLSPVLWPVYVESMGKKRTFYLLCILVGGVIFASLGVAGFWKWAGWTIHYKLSASQLL